MPAITTFKAVYSGIYAKTDTTNPLEEKVDMQIAADIAVELLTIQIS